MSCEEAWLLARFIRDVAPEATLALGPVPVEGEDETFPRGRDVGASNGGNENAVKFTIRAEKCPNRRGVEMVLDAAGGTVVSFDEFVKQAAEGAFAAAWIVGGYPNEWATMELGKAAEKIGDLFVQDMFPGVLTDAASVVVPSCSWAERSGSFVYSQGMIPRFESAIVPLEGCQRDGQVLFALAGEVGLYRAAGVRELMAATMAAFAELHEAPAEPIFAH